MTKSMFTCAIKNHCGSAAGAGGPRRRAAGHTLLEVIVTSTIALIVVPVLAVLILSTSKGFTNFEAASTMKQMNQNSLNRIYLRLGRSKRLFENDVLGTGLLARFNMAGAPAVLTGSKLASIEEQGSFSSAAASFKAASFGNRLFFAYLYGSQDIALSGSSTWRVDTYKLVQYYLTADGAQTVNGVQAYNLVELESGLYADCKQLTALTSSTNRKKLNANLLAAGINTCLLSDTQDYTLAFSSINAAGTLTSVPSHKIAIAKSKNLTQALTGIMGRSYSYGVAPNTGVWTAPKTTVPAYATAGGSFPGGLEVGIIGGANGRQVLVRSVAVAQGERNNLVFNDMSVISSSRDIW
ncbi:MAG: hypothetical protein PHW69_02420 [Elusimicrobiaceae bacterium]|nr:hypothetical protein [Elusimicrobiaceae bacterium]